MADQNLKIRIGAVDKTAGAFRSIGTGLGRVKSAVFSVQTAVTALAGATGFGLLMKSTIETNRSFQSLEASLATFLGSTEDAQKAFKILQQFAATTPFSLREVVGGFNKLVARGLNPTIKSMIAFGNIASGTGKTLDQFIEAAADAAVGEFERLKEFGIKARSEGDKVVFTFKGVETEVKKSGTAITGFLANLGETEFSGAIERQSQTLNGAFSNLGDSFDAFKREIGEAGLNEALVNVAKFFSNIASGSNDTARSIGRFLASGVNMIPQIFIQLGKTAEFVGKNLTFVRQAFIVLTAGVFARAVIGQAVAFLRLASALLTAQKAAIAYRAASKILTIGTIATAVVFAKLTDTLDDMVEMIEGAIGSAMELANKAFPGLEKSLNQLIPSVDSEIQMMENLQKTHDVTTASVEALDAQLAALVPTIATLDGKTTDYSKSLKDFAQDARNVAKNMSDVALRGINSLEDALVSVAMKTQDTKEAFRNMANAIISDIVRMTIRRQISAPIADALSGFMGGTPAPKAIGGPVSAGRPYMVGERGPELFVPNRNGNITPNHAMGGGVTVNQTINLSTGVSQTVRAEVLNMLPQIATAAKGAVIDAKRRGGSYAAQLG